ncbi:MAG: carboxypeptidase-like regulatory domain-containing protein [Bacteroidetes bacterium]|nr:carboxypeptidase-like regulatory domain-containing protein [Bacteroidota bacterium]
MVRVIIIFFTIASSLFSQNNDNYIKGRVTESATGKPLPGANVYLNETMIGTTSDLSGNFIIKNIPAGTYELITSMIGFDVETSRIVFRDGTHIAFNVELNEKLYDFGTVVVEAEKDDTWQQNLIFFKKLFLGQSNFAEGCVIQNETSLEFDREADRFYVHTYEPLKIVNNSLGYQLNCDLIEFYYSEAENSYKYLIKTFFKDLSSEDNMKGYHWTINRSNAYYGSFHHFLKALAKKEAVKDGFEIKLSKIADYHIDLESPEGYGTLNENQITEDDEYGVLQKIVFDDYLRVLYNDPLSKKRILSYLKLRGFEATIDEEGALMESMPFQFFGTWALRGVADMLPRNFEPVGSGMNK